MSLSAIFLLATVATGVAWGANKVSGKKYTKETKPWWVKYGGDFFFVILGVFIFRSFMFESFMIPSPSMVPTLVKPDYILVKKYAYELKLPVFDNTLVKFGDPQRGDVIVFKHPLTPDVDYVKRVVGLPGDKISYLNKRLSINDKLLDVTETGKYKNQERDCSSDLLEEDLLGYKHPILNDPEATASIYDPADFEDKDKCTYVSNGVTCVVPAGKYFVLGDNRDNSQDSRFWGFVPAKNIAGKVTYIWVNPQDTSRIGDVH